MTEVLVGMASEILFHLNLLKWNLGRHHRKKASYTTASTCLFSEIFLKKMVKLSVAQLYRYNSLNHYDDSSILPTLLQKENFFIHCGLCKASENKDSIFLSRHNIQQKF